MGVVTVRPAPFPADPADPGTVVLLDLDGTITDSFPGISASFVHAMAAIGAPEPSEEFLASVAGPPLLDSMAAYGLGEEQAAAAVAAYRERYERVGWRENRVFDGMADLVADLSAAGRTLAVATSKFEPTAVRILEHFGLARFFAAIAGASEDGTRRSKSQVMQRALTVLNSQPGSTPLVMVGDRRHDVDGAAALRVPSIAVGWGYAQPGEAEQATWTVSTVRELREVLGV